MSSGSSSSSSSTPSEPRRRFHPGLLIAFLAVSVGFVFLFRGIRENRPVPVPERLQPVAAVPDLAFTDQTGAPFKPSDLRGKIWVANTIFTRCQGPCPVMTARMAELNKKLGRVNRDVALVSFSVDPDHDTPAVLAPYAERAGGDPARWKFLTTPKAQMDDFIVKGLLQPLAKDEQNLPVHSTRFILVDRTGQIRGFQDGNDPEVVQKLLMDIGDLLRESPTQR